MHVTEHNSNETNTQYRVQYRGYTYLGSCTLFLFFFSITLLLSSLLSLPSLSLSLSLSLSFIQNLSSATHTFVSFAFSLFFLPLFSLSPALTRSCLICKFILYAHPVTLTYKSRDTSNRSSQTVAAARHKESREKENKQKAT